MTQVRESLRPLWGIVVFAGLVTSAHASLLPSRAEVYFSTNMPALSFGNGVKVLRPGDALSTSGDIGIRNWDLVKNFSPSEARGTDFGLDGLQVFKWASGNGRPNVFFSTNTSFFSQTLGKEVTDGDLLSKRGQIIATNQDLVAAFLPDSTDNFGLNAFDILDPGQNQQIWFSTVASFHSDKLGQDVAAGEVLSNKGQVIATNAQLLAAFQPANPNDNYGLDSLYVVNERSQTPVMWFSTTKGFYSQALNRNIGAGDLLSNDGTVIGTNAELTAQFGFQFPFGDKGLDAFTMVRTMDSYLDKQAGRVIPPGPNTPEPLSLCLLSLAIPTILARRRK
jgi:hypothetical protein